MTPFVTLKTYQLYTGCRAIEYYQMNKIHFIGGQTNIFLSETNFVSAVDI